MCIIFMSYMVLSANRGFNIIYETVLHLSILSLNSHSSDQFFTVFTTACKSKYHMKGFSDAKDLGEISTASPQRGRQIEVGRLPELSSS